jgi:hypothetical protein
VLATGVSKVVVLLVLDSDDRSGAALVVGSGVDRCLLVVSWWRLRLCRASLGLVSWLWGVQTSAIGRECVAEMVSGRKPPPSVAMAAVPSRCRFPC